MPESTFFESYWFTYGLLPLMIFGSRIIDVTMDTLRIVFVSKGDKIIAPLLGFFEILIWLIAITRIMQNLDNVTCYLAYAAGFSAGNYLGIKIEEKLALGVQLIRIITHKDSSTLIDRIREKGFVATSIDAEGNRGLVHVVYLVVKRKAIKRVIDIINITNPKAFYTIEDVRAVNKNNGIIHGENIGSIHRWMRKGR